MDREVVERRRSYIKNPDFRELIKRCYESPKSLNELSEECDISITECSSMIQELEEVDIVKSVNFKIEEDDRFSALKKEYIVNRWLVKNYSQVMLLFERS